MKGLIVSQYPVIILCNMFPTALILNQCVPAMFLIVFSSCPLTPLIWTSCGSAWVICAYWLNILIILLIPCAGATRQPRWHTPHYLQNPHRVTGVNGESWKPYQNTMPHILFTRLCDEPWNEVCRFCINNTVFMLGGNRTARWKMIYSLSLSSILLSRLVQFFHLNLVTTPRFHSCVTCSIFLYVRAQPVRPPW